MLNLDLSLKCEHCRVELVLGPTSDVSQYLDDMGCGQGSGSALPWNSRNTLNLGTCVV